LSCDFVASVDLLSSRLRDGVLPMVVIDSLKDELLPWDKLREGKIRMFLIGQLDYLVLSRIYLERWWQVMQSEPWNTPCSIGLNPHSSEWGLLYERLCEAVNSDGSFSVMAGDFGKFEFTIPAEFVEIFVLFIDSVHPIEDEVDSVIRRNLLYSILWPIHLHGRRFYKVFKGQSSGNPFTALFATFCSYVFHRGAWNYCRFCSENSLPLPSGVVPRGDFSDEAWRRDVRFAGTGDDSVVVVRDHPDYNMIFLSCFAVFTGMEYTTCTKDDVVVPYMTFDVIDYLKRRFVPRVIGTRSWCFAPLNKCSIYESVYWVSSSSRSADVRSDIANILRCMLIEAVHHSRTMYIQILRVARRWCERENFFVPFHDYDIALASLCSGSLVSEKHFKGVELDLEVP
jgi:hypothetical protein